MQVQLIYRVIIPLLQRLGVVLIGISTLDTGADNFWTQMIHRTYEDGTPVFNTFVWESSCKACQREGKAASCMHERSKMPFWLSAVNTDVLRALYGNNEETFLRETRNISEDTGGSRFFETQLIEWMTVKANVFRELPGGSFDHFFVTIDPAAGGLKSESVCHVWCEYPPGQLMVSFFYWKNAQTALINSAFDFADTVVLHHTSALVENASNLSRERSVFGCMSPPIRSLMSTLK
ncbi:MAG: hypothetical protein AB7P49_04625 [Bdellovibrionales bacterium]